MRSKLIKYLVALLLLLLTLEIFVRANSKYFHALSDRMLLKAKILERESDTKILFLGTSRFLDAINHRVFSKELQSQNGNYTKSLNAATAGLQSERLAYFAKLAAENKGLTHVIMEASPPAMKKGDMAMPSIDSGKEPIKIDPTLSFQDRIEKHLQKFFVENFALMTHRKALRPQNLTKLLVIYSANLMDPNIWSRKRPLEAIFLPAKETVTKQMEVDLAPALVASNGRQSIPQPKGDEFTNLQQIAEIFKDSGIELIWVAPPVSKKRIPTNHNAKFTRYYQYLANQSGTTFYDYAGIGFDDKWMRDPTHLNPKGRDVFSKLLARHLAKKLSDQTLLGGAPNTVWSQKKFLLSHGGWKPPVHRTLAQVWFRKLTLTNDRYLPVTSSCRVKRKESRSLTPPPLHKAKRIRTRDVI